MSLAHFEDEKGYVRVVRDGDQFKGPDGEILVAKRIDPCEDEHEQEQEDNNKAERG